MWIVVEGDPVGGLNFTGPFAFEEEAVAYGEGLKENWWIAWLQEPED